MRGGHRGPPLLCWLSSAGWLNHLFFSFIGSVSCRSVSVCNRDRRVALPPQRCDARPAIRTWPLIGQYTMVDSSLAGGWR